MRDPYSIPGHDAWKLATPEDDHERQGGSLCPFCGAYSTRQCELEEETDGVCPWEEMQEEPDPDYLRDLREDR
jgi:hypothetical protein